MKKLDKMVEVIKAATKGPWQHDADSELGQAGDVTIWAESYHDGAAVACQVGNGEPDEDGDRYICNMEDAFQPLDGLDSGTLANAEFIVHASRDWFPCVQALKAVLEECDQADGGEGRGAVATVRIRAIIEKTLGE